MAGEAILGLEPPTLTLKTAEHSAPPSPDTIDIQASPEANTDAALLDPAGVRIFRQALDVDLHGLQLTGDQVSLLVDKIYGTPKDPKEVSIRAYEADMARRKRVYLIVTEGYAAAARKSGIAESSMYVWSSQAIPKPFKTKREPVARTKTDQVPKKKEVREPINDITRNSRPLGTASVVASVLYLDGDYDTSALAWEDRALCAQTDPEAFFPEKGGSTREAKKICLSCDVRSECLEYALANDERFGIWGGLSERERRRLKKRAL